jgi:hypothetical protein
VSDIDTAVVDGLKVLDPKRPIREADIVNPRTMSALPSDAAESNLRNYFFQYSGLFLKYFFGTTP